jgi:2-polyprenyl-6-methoxyphenol hydroxylase-like FAD-dependent oxidoreductase
VLVDVDLDRFWRRVGPCPALHRADLHAVLREGMAVRMGTRVRALERVDGPVEVTFDDGRQGRYDLVVGADGLRSTVRRLAVDDRPPTRSASTAGGSSAPAPRHPRASWVRAQTHRRDRTRRLPPLRNPFLRAFGERIFRSNYRPLLEPP